MTTRAQQAREDRVFEQPQDGHQQDGRRWNGKEWL